MVTPAEAGVYALSIVARPLGGAASTIEFDEVASLWRQAKRAAILMSRLAAEKR